MKRNSKYSAPAILGIDVGGSAVKGAPVDVRRGKYLAERLRLPLRDQARPADIARAVARIAKHFKWRGAIGCGFPAAIRGGGALTAANIHKSWIGKNVAAMLKKSTRCPAFVLNDADAAGIAEMTFGAGRGRKGVVLLVTVGTGLGTALFSDGMLLPNTELGHIEIRGKEAEHRASDAVRQRNNLSWKKWAALLNEYLTTMERLFWPGLIVLGGGVSRKHEKFFPYLAVRARLVPAKFRNKAGIIGAALAARRFGSSTTARA